jgi:hypothetical protein
MPRQLASDDWQVSEQEPFRQTCPGGQVPPQVPQFLLSDWRFTQVPLQLARDD